MGEVGHGGGYDLVLGGWQVGEKTGSLQKLPNKPSKVRAQYLSLAMVDSLGLLLKPFNRSGKRIVVEQGGHPLLLFRILIRGITKQRTQGYLYATISVKGSLRRVRLEDEWFRIQAKDKIKEVGFKDSALFFTGHASTMGRDGEEFLKNAEKFLEKFNTFDEIADLNFANITFSRTALDPFKSDNSEWLWDKNVWSFWREWYQGFLDGRPLDWELQRRVALIPDADWEKGPAHIAEIIEKIRLEFRTSVGESIYRDEDAGVFRVRSETRLPSEPVQFARERIDMALGNALRNEAANGFRETSYEAV